MASGQSISKDELSQLRDDLKVWEKEFAAANEGRKATRDDIKAAPAIGIVHSDLLSGRY